jgi:hypothetical protein
MPILETVIDSDPTAADLTTNRAVAYDSIEQALQVIRPRLLAAGGRQRLVLLVGNDNERKALAEQIAEAHGGTISVVVLPGATPMLIHEAQQIPLSSIMGRLQTSIGSDEKVLNRLQARSDVRFNAPPSEKGSGAFLAPQEK